MFSLKGYRRAFEGRWRLSKQRDELRTYPREQARDETQVTMQMIKAILASCLGHFQVGSYRYRSLIEGLYIPSRSLVEALQCPKLLACSSFTLASLAEECFQAVRLRGVAGLMKEVER